MKKLLHFITVLLISIILFFSCTIGLGESVDTEVPTVSIVSPDPHAVFSICGDFLIQGTWKDDGTIKSVVVTKWNNTNEYIIYNKILNSIHILPFTLPNSTATTFSRIAIIKNNNIIGINSPIKV